MLSLIQALQQQLAMSRQIQLIVVKRLSSQHSAMDDASDTQLKTKSQLKSELGSEEALKKESSKDDVSSDELSIEGQDPSVALLDENAVMKSTANDDSQALFAQNEVGEKPQTSPQSVSPSSTEESSDSQTVTQSMDEGSMFYSSYNNPMVNYVLKKCLRTNKMQNWVQSRLVQMQIQ